MLTKRKENVTTKVPFWGDSTSDVEVDNICKRRVCKIYISVYTRKQSNMFF
jgi:hypothetical protein